VDKQVNLKMLLLTK